MKPEDLLAMMPFSVASGITLVEASRERAVGRMAWSPQRCTTEGALHGGALMTLADSVGAVCAFLNLPEGAGTATIESNTNFFRAVREGSVTATARPIHIGRTLITVQTELRDDEGRLVGQTVQTQAVLKP